MTKRILCAIDVAHPECEAPVLRRAAQLAELDGAELDVITVAPTLTSGYLASFFPEGATKEMLEHARDALHAFTKETLGSDAGLRHIVSSGSIHEAILETARKIDASMIVLGARRPDLKDILLGPNATRVAGHAECSVMIVRADGG